LINAVVIKKIRRHYYSSRPRRRLALLLPPLLFTLYAMLAHYAPLFIIFCCLLSLMLLYLLSYAISILRYAAIRHIVSIFTPLMPHFHWRQPLMTRRLMSALYHYFADILCHIRWLLLPAFWWCAERKICYIQKYDYFRRWWLMFSDYFRLLRYAWYTYHMLHAVARYLRHVTRPLRLCCCRHVLPCALIILFSRFSFILLLLPRHFHMPMLSILRWWLLLLLFSPYLLRYRLRFISFAYATWYHWLFHIYAITPPMTPPFTTCLITPYHYYDIIIIDLLTPFHYADTTCLISMMPLSISPPSSPSREYFDMPPLVSPFAFCRQLCLSFHYYITILIATIFIIINIIIIIRRLIIIFRQRHYADYFHYAIITLRRHYFDIISFSLHGLRLLAASAMPFIISHYIAYYAAIIYYYYFHCLLLLLFSLHFTPRHYADYIITLFYFHYYRAIIYYYFRHYYYYFCRHYYFMPLLLLLSPLLLFSLWLRYAIFIFIFIHFWLR